MKTQAQITQNAKGRTNDVYLMIFGYRMICTMDEKDISQMTPR